MEKYKNKNGFTKEELIELGIDYGKMNYPYGEMNIIVQWFGRHQEGYDNNEDNFAYPDVYQPRRNMVWSVTDDKIDLSDEEKRKDFISHLRDSSERLKVLSHLLSRQAQELEESGYTDTVCYFPEAQI